MKEQLMVKLYFIDEKWPANMKEYGESQTEHVLHASFGNTGLGEYKKFHFDEYFYEHGKKGDFKLIEEIIDYKPDLVVYSWLVGIHNPEPHTLKIINKLGFKIVCIWWDFLWKLSMETAEQLTPFVNMHIPMGDPYIAYKIPMHSKRKHLPLWTPNDNTMYYGNPSSKREIDIAFSGDIYRNEGYRKDYIDAIEKMNYNVYVGGKLKEDRVPINEFTKTLRNTKIIPNFTKGDLKGRVFEATLIGAMLMEPEKSPTEAFFIPDKEYVRYSDHNDFVDKVKYYIEHDYERIEIAKAGQARSNNNYSTERFWKLIFYKLGIIKYLDTNLLYNKHSQMPIDKIIEDSYIPVGGE
jgi:hypothetical protein